MPQAIASALVTYAGFTATAATVTAYAVVIAGTLAYSDYSRRKAQARARAAANASAKDREVMIRSAIAPRRIVYGRDRISGPIVYMESTGDKSQYLHMVVALAAHECDAIETVYFNEVPLPDADGDGWITSGEYAKGSTTESGTHTGTTNGSGELTLPHDAVAITAAYTEIGVGEAATQTHHTGYSHTAGSNTITGLPADTSVTIGYTYTQAATPLVRVRKYLGTSTQTADADLVAESDGKWTTDHRGRGICYLYVRLEYDQDVFGSTGVPNISAVVRGKKVYDPRTTTTAWSNNAALCVADYLRSDEGMRADSAEVPDSEIIAAANICDEEIDLSLDDEDVQARYTCDLSITTDRSPRDVLAELLACMSGRAVWTQGRWLVRPGAYRTPTLTITADMLAGPVSVMPKASRSELFNAVRTTYRDATSFAELQAPLVENSGYEADDGGVQIVRQIDVPTLSDTYRAQRLAKIELERARQALTVKLACNLKAYDLAPSDTVLLTLATYGWAAKAFEVLERTLTREGTIQYTLRETAAGVYDWAWGEATIGDLAPDTNLPNPFGLPAILQNLAADEDAIRLADGTIITQAVVTWDASESPFVANGGSIQYQTAKVGTPWGTGSLPGDATTVTLGPLQVGVAYVFRARAINASGRAGDWAHIGLVAQGLAAPPDDVTGLDYEIKPGQVWITWDPCEEADYAATELRYDGTGWDDATFLWRGAGSDYQHPRPPNGTYTVRAKHIDTSGTYSANAASISVTVDDSIDADGGGTLRLVTDRFPYHAYADGSTHTSTTPPLQLTAVLIGLSGAVTWTATAYDVDTGGTSLGPVTLGGSGLVRTLSGSDFAAPGTANEVKRVVVRAAHASGSFDERTVYRQDPTITTPRLYVDNERAEVVTDADGNYGDYSEAFTDVEVFAGIDVVTDDYEFTITPDAGLTATINGGAGPVDGAVDVTVAVTDSTISDGVVLIEATDGVTDLSGQFRVVKRLASGDAYTMQFDPPEIVLPVGIDGAVSSYANAKSEVTVLRGTVPDTAAGVLTTEDLGVISTLTGTQIHVTAFLGLGSMGALTSADLTLPAGWETANSVTWCDDVWVMFGAHASATYTEVMRSPDFEAWAEVDTGEGGHWNRAAFGGQRLVAIESGINGNRCLRSGDKGLTWTLDALSQTATWLHIHFGDGFLASASGSTAGSYSADGDAWANRTLPASGCALTFAAPTWAAVSPAGALYTSTDAAVTWSGSRNSLMSLPAGLVVSKAIGFLGAIVAALDGPTDHVKIGLNGGATWLTTILPGTYSDPSALLVVRDVLYLISEDLTVYCTADGLVWTEADAPMGIAGIADGVYALAESLPVDYLPALRPAEALGLDDDTVLLIHADGTNGSTAIVDSSSYGHTITAHGTAVISTTESKFGGSSLYGGLSAGYIRVAMGSVGLMTGDFTIEGYRLPAGNDVVFMAEAGGYLYNDVFQGYGGPSLSLTGIWSGATWKHWAISRVGSTIRTFLDGAQVDSDTYSGTVDLQALRFGMFVPNNNRHWRGYQDAIRVSTVGRYTGAFTPDAEYAATPPKAYKQALAATTAGVGFVRATWRKPGEAPVVGSVPVRLGTVGAEQFTASASPPYLTLPATLSGDVTDFSNASISVRVTGAGGRDATAEYSWIWTATYMTPSSGTGSTATFTAMAAAQDRGQVTFVGEAPGRQPISGTLNIDKLRGGSASGPVVGAAFEAFSFVSTYAELIFRSDGTWATRSSSGGAWTERGTWYSPASGASSKWLRVEDSGHALTSGTVYTWLAMTSDRPYVLSDATSGTHRTDLVVFFADDNLGTNAAPNYGALELRVP